MDNKKSGFTLIEMLVGIVIGMIVVAAASVMMVSVLKSQKDVTASARLNQELGAAMAVMSNEIRRAGFRICDMKKMLDSGSNCPKPDEDEVPYITYVIGDDIKIGDGGNCIEYRYNANLDDDPDTLGEHRGFRFNSVNNTVQMGDPTQNFACTDPAASLKWIDLTDSNVIEVSALSFSTTGSKCRNMSGNFYWVVGDGETGLACDDGTKLDTSVGCVDLNDPADPLVTAAGCSAGATDVLSEWVTDEWVTQPDPPPVPPYKDALFGVNQIIINLQADLTRDSAVSKILKTSVKIANPWIRLR